MTGAPLPVVVFDGDCGLCNGFVAWLIKRDQRGEFLIAGSTGDVGRAALDLMGLPYELAESTLVLATADRPYLRSDAVAAVAVRLPWPWRAAAGIRIVPRPLRDAVYSAIAARRPRRPSADPACGTPPPELVKQWRARLATMDHVHALAAARTGSPPR